MNPHMTDACRGVPPPSKPKVEKKEEVTIRCNHCLSKYHQDFDRVKEKIRYGLSPVVCCGVCGSEDIEVRLPITILKFLLQR